MSEALLSAFAKAKREERPAFIPYIPAGYPAPDQTVPILLALEKAGADIIEVGVPFTDPIADGPTIQAANQ
ncbi:tryptophan synthase alpha chain, partial [Sphaeroforma arctica JP610]